MRDFWDERYAQQEYAYGQQPNAFFRQQVEMLPPGRLLLPGEGEGRNAAYAALKGWEVQAFDLSAQGALKARRLAAQLGVHFDYRVEGLEDFMRRPVQAYDLVGLLYFHLPAALRQAFFGRLQEWVLPGGRVVLEGFSLLQLERGRTSGGPKDGSMLYTLPMLQQELPGFRTLQLSESTIELQEGAFHQGTAEVICWVGERV